MEAQWGPLERYAGLSTTASRNLLISGLQLGNVFIGVQPLLGVEGDPMRLLFDRCVIVCDCVCFAGCNWQVALN